MTDEQEKMVLEADQKRLSRRQFLLRLASFSGLLLGNLGDIPDATDNDKDLKEADFYTPHNLAG